MDNTKDLEMLKNSFLMYEETKKQTEKNMKTAVTKDGKKQQLQHLKKLRKKQQLNVSIKNMELLNWKKGLLKSFQINQALNINISLKQNQLGDIMILC